MNERKKNANSFRGK